MTEIANDVAEHSEHALRGEVLHRLDVISEAQPRLAGLVAATAELADAAYLEHSENAPQATDHLEASTTFAHEFRWARFTHALNRANNDAYIQPASDETDALLDCAISTARQRGIEVPTNLDYYDNPSFDAVLDVSSQAEDDVMTEAMDYARERFAALPTEPLQFTEQERTVITSAYRAAYWESVTGNMRTLERFSQTPVVSILGRLVMSDKDDYRHASRFPSTTVKYGYIFEAMDAFQQSIEHTPAGIAEELQSFEYSSITRKLIDVLESSRGGYTEEDPEYKIIADFLEDMSGEARMKRIKVRLGELLDGAGENSDQLELENVDHPNFDTRLVQRVERDIAKLAQQGKTNKEILRTLARRYHSDHYSADSQLALDQDRMTYLNVREPNLSATERKTAQE